MFLALLLVAFSVIQTSPAASAKDDGDQKELERLEAEWNGAQVRGDAAALDRIFAEDLVVVVPGLRVMTKADSLGMFTSGGMKFERFDFMGFIGLARRTGRFPQLVDPRSGVI